MYTKDGKLLSKENAREVYDLLVKARQMRSLAEVTPCIDHDNGEKTVVRWNRGGKGSEAWESIAVVWFDFDRANYTEELFDNIEQFAEAYEIKSV